MTTSEKIAKVQKILEPDETATSELVMVYLDLAKEQMFDRLYPFIENRPFDVPARYDLLQCELASRLFLRRGGEGETNHEENGVNRTYGSVNDEDILSRLVPFAKVMG